ncbi:hypothetical protein [Candidatus Contendibacter odensensis]|uniref:hypothetical protein n=1 Tax=Candidatus Contendibacter odensensis TaxID=1400860 RepID=UPI0005546D70|nr:hypothetical protein [Candidatus Contendobacter odensis]MBK8755538.1 hypothetical protein [Candidatus Competibacteraceae bacterium]
MVASVIHHDPAVITPTILGCALRCGEKTIGNRLNAGLIPKPDERRHGNMKLWRVSTIQQWDRSIANRISAIIEVLGGWA